LLAVAAIPDSPSPTISNVALGRWLRDFADVHLDRLFLRYERVDGQGSQLWSLRASPSPAATGQEGEVRVDEPGLNRVLEAWRAAFGIDRTVSIDELVAVEHKDLKAALLAVAAMPDTDSGSSVPNHSISNILLKRWLREANGIRLGRLSLQRVVRRGSAGSQLWSLREGDAVPPDALAAWQRP
jgi:hypothetical protein